MAIGHHPRAHDRLTESSVYKDQPLAGEGLGRGGAKAELRHWLRQWTLDTGKSCRDSTDWRGAQWLNSAIPMDILFNRLPASAKIQVDSRGRKL